MIGGQQSGDDRRGAGPQSPAVRDLRTDPELEAVGWVQALERPHDQVVAVNPNIELGLHGKRACLHNLKLEVQGQRGRQHVEARPEVRGRGGDADQAPARERAHPSTARSSAGSSASHGTTAPACPSAVCGSLSPWPVSTQTTRRASPAP